jgi:hypothetical protein
MHTDKPGRRASGGSGFGRQPSTSADRLAAMASALAAMRLGVDQPTVSRLLLGYLTNISAERLM